MAIAGVGVGLLTVLVPLLLVLAAGIRREIDQLRTDVTADISSVHADVAEFRRDLHAVSERVARIEVALTGPHVDQSPRSLRHSFEAPSEPTVTWLDAMAGLADLYGKSDDAETLREAAALTARITGRSVAVREEPARED